MYETIINKFVEAEVLLDNAAYEKIKKQSDSLKFTESLDSKIRPPTKRYNDIDRRYVGPVSRRL